MAIDRIPGVGPTNSDIANATAAVVPNSAAITAAVPTAAQIATAVAAPSAATIAAAVAAPSAATIAAAVAAPSAATIATSVAGAVPTLAQINTAVNTQTNNSAIATAVAAAVPTIGAINTSVQTYAPSSAGWTYIGTVAPAAVATASFSSISGYKKLKLVGFMTTTSGSLLVQFNSDATAGNYASVIGGISSYMGANLTGNGNTSALILTAVNSAMGFNVDIDNANLTTVMKFARIDSSGTASVSSINLSGSGTWKSTAAITSIQLLNTGAAAMTGNVYLLGQN